MVNEIKSLPPLPASIVRIHELCMSTDTDIDELAKVIEGDPMLSANILKSVNSPLYGMSKEISSIPQAIMLFGISMIRGFAAANAIKKAIQIDLTPYGVTIESLTETSTLQTALIREWYRNVDKTMLPLLQSCAFFMELGKLLASLRVIVSGEFERFSQEMTQDKSIIEIERCYLGMSSYEIASMMFEHWNFETPLVEALRDISNPETTNPYSQVLSVVVKAVNVRQALSEKGKNEAFEAIATLGLNREAFEEALISLKSRNKE
ncbi:HDOD domain-containing protein [Sulfuricurvum sp.]|uniref:HDOD domain-containing protein n=1 Tax=Sulfuricurvum sp. TaxID=2025608 RepID=UPI00260BB897|nr:HDOD domain-containing protein [Sulfuricurvum sp.]MDD2267814.1 HDOD domain-containing protein [Sulfuricurvum sp.]MDD2783504.1 HDOD domain-containing protein [Sulfuricurvum sp.]